MTSPATDRVSPALEIASDPKRYTVLDKERTLEILAELESEMKARGVHAALEPVA